MNLRTILTAAAVLAALAGPAAADLITQWTFNSNPIDGTTTSGTLAPATGSGTVALIGGTTSTFAGGGGSTDPETSDDSGWNTLTYPAASANNKTAGIEVAVSTLGYEDVVVSLDLRTSNTSSRYGRFQYSTDGTTFVDGPSLFTSAGGDTWNNGITLNLIGVPAADNNPNFKVRFVSEFETTGAYVAAKPTSTYVPTGTWRFDMVTVAGEVVPEPTTLALLVLAVAAGAVVCRRRR